jgi:hypothetical protein
MPRGLRRFHESGHSHFITFRLLSAARPIFRENGVVEIESECTARERELKTFAGPARTFLIPG